MSAPHQSHHTSVILLLYFIPFEVYSLQVYYVMLCYVMLCYVMLSSIMAVHKSANG